jgi:hypothetical protein
MDGQIEQCIYIKFCVKFSESMTENLKVLLEAFGVHCLSRISCFKASRVLVEDDECQGDQAPAK